jgi:hypothetical protein
MSQPETNAEKPQIPRLDFKQAAREILHDHPEWKGHLLFVDPDTHEKHGGLRARLRAAFSQPFRDRLKQAFSQAAAAKGPIADMVRLRSVSGLFLSVTREDAAEARFDLHRQAGRLVVPRDGGNIRYFQALFGVPYAAETAAADAYAAIRYLREPDADREYLRRLSLRRAIDFLATGNPENLSSPVLDKIIADRDFSKMKIGDLVDTVSIYTKGYTPSREQSDALVKEFAPLKGKALDEAGLKQLLQITQATRNPLAAKLGGKVLAAAGIDVAKQPTPAPATPKAA